jgi:hypothetical protein
MNSQPLDLSRLQELREQSASIALSEWISNASNLDLAAVIRALETISKNANSELARRAWNLDPRTYRRAA